jgi:hypothetical protein
MPGESSHDRAEAIAVATVFVEGGAVAFPAGTKLPSD